MYPGSKNPPDGVTVLLQNKHGRWGIGYGNKGYDKNMYFNFISELNHWTWEPKSSFKNWAFLPAEK